MAEDPALARIGRVVSVTWPGAEEVDTGAFICRRGLNGGRRAGGATPTRDITAEDLPPAEDVMRGWGQRPMVAVRSDQTELEQVLISAGYDDHDHSIYFVGPAADMAHPVPRATAFPVWEPLAIMRDLWAENDIPAERIAVMERATCPKTTILGRVDDQPGGCVYVGAHDGMAMVHSLMTIPALRRRGLARTLMHAVANWAVEQGCEEVGLLVGRENTGAHALYTSLGMQPVGSYHYRSRD